MKPSKDPNMTYEYRIGMLSAYALSLLAIVLPLFRVSDGSISLSISVLDLLSLSKLAQLGVSMTELGPVIMVLRFIIIITALLSVTFIVLFLLDITSRVKEGFMLVTAMSPMGVYGSIVGYGIIIKTVLVQSGVSGETFGIGLGSIFGCIAYMYIFYRTLVYLCMYKTSATTPSLREEIAPAIEKVQEMIPALKAKGQLKGVSGVYAGQIIPMEDGDKIILGRSAQYCNLIVEGSKVSRKHCSIVFHKAKGTYTLEDFSSNGTFRKDGTKYGKTEELTVDSIFYLGNKENGFQVK